jgi:hypothetical protein
LAAVAGWRDDILALAYILARMVVGAGTKQSKEFLVTRTSSLNTHWLKLLRNVGEKLSVWATLSHHMLALKDYMERDMWLCT